MKTLSLLLLAVSAFAQSTVTVSITNAQPAALQDLFTHYISAVAGTVGTTTVSLDAMTTPVTITYTPQANASVSVGDVVLLDQEPCTVTSTGTGTLSCARGTIPMAELATHANGVNLLKLIYSTPGTMIYAEALAPYIARVQQSLGMKSASVSGVTSTITVH